MKKEKEVKGNNVVPGEEGVLLNGAKINEDLSPEKKVEVLMSVISERDEEIKALTQLLDGCMKDLKKLNDQSKAFAKEKLAIARQAKKVVKMAKAPVVESQIIFISRKAPVVREG